MFRYLAQLDHKHEYQKPVQNVPILNSTFNSLNKFNDIVVIESETNHNHHIMIGDFPFSDLIILTGIRIPRCECDKITKLKIKIGGSKIWSIRSDVLIDHSRVKLTDDKLYTIIEINRDVFGCGISIHSLNYHMVQFMLKAKDNKMINIDYIFQTTTFIQDNRNMRNFLIGAGFVTNLFQCHKIKPSDQNIHNLLVCASFGTNMFQYHRIKPNGQNPCLYKVNGFMATGLFMHTNRIPTGYTMKFENNGAFPRSMFDQSKTVGELELGFKLSIIKKYNILNSVYDSMRKYGLPNEIIEMIFDYVGSYELLVIWIPLFGLYTDSDCEAINTVRKLQGCSNMTVEFNEPVNGLVYEKRHNILRYTSGMGGTAFIK